MNIAPITLFVYNRLEHTKRTVEALHGNSLAQESELFVFSDGPKNEHDLDKVMSVRDYVRGISGFKKVNIIERKENWGLSRSIVSGVTEIVNGYGKIIVMEDDLSSSPYFLQYMNDALDLYENENKVISIHGYVYPVKSELPETFFLKNPSCWGWATWKRGWDLFEKDGKNLLGELERKQALNEFDFSGSYNFSGMLRRQIAGHNDSWAIRWYASAFLADKLTLYPGKSLIDNTGFDGSGIHSNKTTLFKPDMADAPITVRKIETRENMAARREFIGYFRSIRPMSGKGSILKRIARKITSQRMRNRIVSFARNSTANAKRILAKSKGIRIVTPNPDTSYYYMFKGKFGNDALIIDVGCGFDADFSMYMIEKFGLKCIGIDPTLKHKDNLDLLSRKTRGLFSHKLFAISAVNGKITFNESEDNVSGSIFDDHKNVKSDKIRTYEVDTVNLASLPDRLGLTKIDYIKLDLEGAEYDLFERSVKNDLVKYNQIFVEFHHHALPRYTIKDTLRVVEKIKSFGFKSFSIYNNDFLFYR